MVAHFVTPPPKGLFIATYMDGRTPGIPHVEVPSAPTDGSQVWLFPGWSAPAVIDEKAEIKARRLLGNNDSYEKATRFITTDYPQLEKDTWPTQDKESKAWVADPENALTPWIDRAAATRGIDRDEYLRRTLAKAQQFEMVSSYLTGTRQKYEDQIKDGGDPVLDYVIPASLYAEMQAKTLQIMTTNATELQELF
ncbi:hypothetical protein [Pseudomonas sp. NPDC079086]|uniref:hypothetical protein n=1 Tax=unclassified Pseudomonas TaxID=196821 RepID=UPI0037C98E17